jgi:hypothetical protein
VVHAEMSAIYNATYSGTSLDGATLYVYGLPSGWEIIAKVRRLATSDSII